MALALGAVVFDLDGTLVDSLDDIAGHLNAALAEAGLPTRTYDEVRAGVGFGAEQLVARSVPAGVPHAAVFARFRALYRSAPYARTRLHAGLDATLDALVARGSSLGVLSNKPHDLVVRICAHLLGAWPFRVVVGERSDRPNKPHPDAMLSVVGELGVPRERCALVGDSEVDIATARAAGVVGIAVTWGLRDVETLRAAQPDHLVESPAALTALLS